MNLTMRPYATEDDYYDIRAFLRQVMLLNGVREKSWHVARFDYWRWHGILNLRDGQLEQDVFLWHAADGQLIGVLNREEAGNAYLQVHPHLRTLELEDAMIALAEERLAVRQEGQRVLAVWTDAEDSLRPAILRRRGYARTGVAESQWRRDLRGPIPEPVVPAGYTVRALGDGEAELAGRSRASWRAFHWDGPGDGDQGHAWYHNLQRCPLYRRDLDIVAVAPDGEIASFATTWYDDVTRSAYFEPVATVPAHVRRGLARAVMTAAMRRLQLLGAALAFVGGYEPIANAVYAAVLSPEHDRSEKWQRRW